MTIAAQTKQKIRQLCSKRKFITITRIKTGLFLFIFVCLFICTHWIKHNLLNLLFRFKSQQKKHMVMILPQNPLRQSNEKYSFGLRLWLCLRTSLARMLQSWLISLCSYECTTQNICSLIIVLEESDVNFLVHRWASELREHNSKKQIIKNSTQENKKRNITV